MFFELISQWIFNLLLMFGYVSSSNAFPPPLTSEEEEKYLLLFEQGDEQARRILIEHNLRLVAHIAKKYGDENTMDDLISIGSIGLIKGINTFNKSKSTKLSAYISRCIENEVLMYLRSNKKRMGDVSLDECIGVDKEGNNMTYSDILPADTRDIAEDVWARLESGRLIHVMKRCLTPDEIKILCYRYGLAGVQKKTQREIAASLGISRSYVSRIEKRCLKKLYNEMNQKDDDLE